MSCNVELLEWINECYETKNEIWKTIKYSPNYEISNLGNVRNQKTNKLLKINYEKLKKNNTRARPYLCGKGYYLHRIVAEHFIENPNNLPEVNHIDGDFYNNCSDNLEWISKMDNMKHANENNLIKRYTRGIIITNKRNGEIKEFEKVIDCSEFLGKNCGVISNTCRGKRIDKEWEMKYSNENQERQIEKNEDIIWKEYPECKKYLVSNTGEIKNKKTNRIMMGSKVNGYRFMTLFIDKNTPKLNRLAHRMVAETFLENPDKKPVVNHKNTNILDNHVNNLEWVTYKENMNTEETIKNLKKGKNSKIILQIDIESGKIMNQFDGINDCEKKIGFHSCWSICNYYHNKDNKYRRTYQKKYIFIFEEDKDQINDFLQRENYKPKSNEILQIDIKTNEIINEFKSGYEASKILKINQSGINQCCLYYRYNDENRPKKYKLRTFHGYKFCNKN